MYILSVDFGTSSVKASILNKKLEIISSAKIEYELKVLKNDKIELDPGEIFEAFIQCTQKFEDYIQDVDVLAFDILSPSVMFLDENGEPLYPLITHLDRRSQKQMKKILRIVGEKEFQNITGVLPFMGGVSVTSILWIKDNLPEVFNKAFKISHFNTYFYKKLTGIWATDPVNASMMGLYETIKDTDWSKDLCKTLKIPLEKLPDISPAGSILGGLCKGIADLTGLRENIPVALGSNDAATALVGADCSDAGDVLNISGSNEILTIITDKPVLNKKYYIRRAITPGRWQIFAITAGGFAIEWFRKVAYKDMDVNAFYGEHLISLIENEKIEAKVKFLPYLAGDRHSLDKKRGALTGLTLGTKRDDMLVAILHGIHEPMINTMDLAAEFLKPNKTIKITGGLSTNDYILQLKKNIFPDSDFVVYEDCPIIGNAKLALKSIGM